MIMISSGNTSWVIKNHANSRADEFAAIAASDIRISLSAVDEVITTVTIVLDSVGISKTLSFSTVNA